MSINKNYLKSFGRFCVVRKSMCREVSKQLDWRLINTCSFHGWGISPGQYFIILYCSRYYHSVSSLTYCNKSLACVNMVFEFTTLQYLFPVIRLHLSCLFSVLYFLTVLKRYSDIWHTSASMKSLLWLVDSKFAFKWIYTLLEISYSSSSSTGSELIVELFLNIHFVWRISQFSKSI